MSFPQNLKVYFNQENLRVWSDPKVNPNIEKDLDPLATKLFFL